MGFKIESQVFLWQKLQKYSKDWSVILCKTFDLSQTMGYTSASVFGFEIAKGYLVRDSSQI